MAIEYSFEMTTKREAAEVLGSLAAVRGLHTSRKGLRGKGIDGVWVAPADAVFQSHVEKDFGFRPALGVMFRVDKFDDTEEGIRTVIRAGSELLRSDPGDALLLYNREVVLLVRKGGQLLINKAEDFWTPSLFSELAMPYQLEAITPGVL